MKKVQPSIQDGKGRLDIRTVEIGSRSSSTFIASILQLHRTASQSLSPMVDATLKVSARKEVILSAGAFGTPHILLNSGIGEESHLDSVGVKTVHNLPDVGKGMSDHVCAFITYTMNATTPV